MATLLAIFVSTALAAGVIASTKSNIASIALGGTLLLYAAAGLLNFHLNVSTQAERWAGPIAGAITGVITGATGTFVVPALPYLAGLGLARDELVQALGLSFTVSTVALGLGLLWHHALEFQSISHSAFAIVPALVGMLIGSRIRRRVAPDRFRRWFFVGLGVLALHLIYAAL
jgi:uncharacterized membrane protein YfcA